MKKNIPELAKLLRYYSLISTTEAGSGHPSSCLSAADLMAVLCFGGHYKYDLSNPDYENNDRLIFSKGHAAPLFYSLYALATNRGLSSEKEDSPLHRAMEPEEMLTLRKFGSRLEGHPTTEFPYTEVPTGSLGQGLSIGVGMALNAKMSARGGSASGGDKTLIYRTFVLLGDSEMAEGSVWEAFELASYYKLDNLIAILDCNRLGQRGETMLGADVETYKNRAESFGFEAIVVQGHNLNEIEAAFLKAKQVKEKPVMIIARTLKGKGVSVLEDKDGKHGVPLKKEELEVALKELGEVDKSLVGEMAMPEQVASSKNQASSGQAIKFTQYDLSKSVATRKAYGNALANLVEANPNVVVLDAETSNSTYAEFVKKKHPEKFVECFIAEQNMVSMALGFARRGKIPFVSTFATFLTRAYDQIRMSALAQSNIKFIGSHAGVSIGEDGSSQMGLEEIAMFRALPETVVLYPSDAVSTEKLLYLAAEHKGNVYIQTTRKETPILYSLDDRHQGGIVNHEFKIGGSCILRSSENDKATIIAAGITVHEALAAYEELKKENINIRVIDLYSIKPLDLVALKKAVEETKNIITVEDNHHEGGLAEAVLFGINELLGLSCVFKSLSVKKIPHSGKPTELMAYQEIDKGAIIKAVKQVNSKQ